MGNSVKKEWDAAIEREQAAREQGLVGLYDLRTYGSAVAADATRKTLTEMLLTDVDPSNGHLAYLCQMDPYWVNQCWLCNVALVPCHGEQPWKTGKNRAVVGATPEFARAHSHWPRVRVVRGIRSGSDSWVEVEEVPPDRGGRTDGTFEIEEID